MRSPPKREACASLAKLPESEFQGLKFNKRRFAEAGRLNMASNFFVILRAQRVKKILQKKGSWEGRDPLVHTDRNPGD